MSEVLRSITTPWERLQALAQLAGVEDLGGARHRDAPYVFSGSRGVVLSDAVTDQDYPQMPAAETLDGLQALRVMRGYDPLTGWRVRDDATD